MWYAGLPTGVTGQTGYATSLDGITWEKYSGNPVLPWGASGQWDRSAAEASAVLYDEDTGQYQMWYHGTSTQNISSVAVGYATSPDGLVWTKDGANPVLSPSENGWDSDNVWFPKVLKEDGKYRMWYSGRGNDGIDRLGYAEDFSNAAHVDSVLATPIVMLNDNRVAIDAWIANPHSENLTARALIFSDGDSIASVELLELGDGLWQGTWAQPFEGRNYSVGVELNNNSAGYIHNSFDWGISDQFEIGTIHERGLVQDGNQRSYLIYVPAAYDGQEAWPLVINYHGFQSNATNQMDIHSKMNVIADSAHFLVAYPQGLNVQIPGFGTAPETPAFWVDQNNCHGDTIIIELPDVNPNDGSTVTRIDYTGCDDNTEVLFYRINNGGHGWPGGSPSFPFIGNTNYDINASSEIWNFFKRNPHPEITTGTPVTWRSPQMARSF
jgi:hypothetical protein